MAKLYVVATPIGNLNDLTARTQQALTEADMIAAEDTRVTMKLLTHYGIQKPMVSCHRHNEDARAPQLISHMLEEDLTVALTCDAGTPGISDPGHLLVRAAWEAGIAVEPIPGPSAVVTALSVSGFDAREFAFYGFLPREKKALREKLDSIHRAGIPVFVLYESPHRVIELVETICEMWEKCDICVCSDLTKRFERIYRGNVQTVLNELRQNENVEKGEYCMVVDIGMLPPAEIVVEKVDCTAFMVSKLLDGVSIRESTELAAQKGYARNDIYRAKLKIEEMFEEEE